MFLNTIFDSFLIYFKKMSKDSKYIESDDFSDLKEGLDPVKKERED